MKFSFRKSFKIAPGIRLNVSKRGLGVSAGVKGARVGLSSTKGVYTSASIPGTGISSVNYLNDNKQAKSTVEGVQISPIKLVVGSFLGLFILLFILVILASA